MIIKLKIDRKAFVQTVLYFGRLDYSSFESVTDIDRINMRELIVSVYNKLESWKLDKNYSTKKYTISIEANKYATMLKMFDVLNKHEYFQSKYEKSCFEIMKHQATKQIDHYLFINQTLVML